MAGDPKHHTHAINHNSQLKIHSAEHEKPSCKSLASPHAWVRLLFLYSLISHPGHHNNAATIFQTRDTQSAIKTSFSLDWSAAASSPSFVISYSSPLILSRKRTVLNGLPNRSVIFSMRCPYETSGGVRITMISSWKKILILMNGGACRVLYGSCGDSVC